MLLQRVDLILLQCIDFVLNEKKGRIGIVVVVVGTNVIVLYLAFVVYLVVVLFCFLVSIRHGVDLLQGIDFVLNQ